jgi:AraC family transcriptional regulator
MQNPHSVLVYLRPTRLMYVRETGPYDRTIPKAWQRLTTWLNDNGLYAPIGRGDGLARDNPADVINQNCRCDACVEIPPEVEDRALRDLGITTLPGGAYACRRLAGSYSRMHSVVANVYSEFVALPGLIRQQLPGGFDLHRQSQSPCGTRAARRHLRARDGRRRHWMFKGGRHRLIADDAASRHSSLDG